VRAIDQVLALAGSKQAAGERDFPRAMLEAMTVGAVGSMAPLVPLAAPLVPLAGHGARRRRWFPLVPLALSLGAPVGLGKPRRSGTRDRPW